MIKAKLSYRRLYFKFLAKTSRDALTYKDAYYLALYDDQNPTEMGVGEFNCFPGLAADAFADYPAFISGIVSRFNSGLGIPSEYSSVNFAFESAMHDLAGGGKSILFPSDWCLGLTYIPINGLIWMGDYDEMLRRIDEKLQQGFSLLKLKIGGIDFESETALLKRIRKRYSPDILTIRLDANGAFDSMSALSRLETLSGYNIHSLEQPVKAGQPDLMKEICSKSPIPVALDEELIGVRSEQEISEMLDYISPHFLVIKPALCGGFERADMIVRQAESRGVGWWATSALESDIGLSAIAQWVAAKNNSLPQGLGTGQLYNNNIPSPICLRGEKLYYMSSQEWDLSSLRWKDTLVL